MIAPNTVYDDTSVLPPGDSPELDLVAASPQERIETIKLNSTAWKGFLDLESYIAREDHLRQQRLNRDGLTCWILVDRRQPEGQRTILSSCETYKKDALFAHDGRVDDVVAYGVGSVYCRSEFRGQGYAKRMMQLLSAKLDSQQMGTEGPGNSAFSVLFSDIGKKFYAQFGWKPFPSSHLSLPPISKEQHDESLSTVTLPKATALHARDIRDCMCNDELIQKERDFLRVASQESQTPKVAIAPSFEHFEWHWAREEFLSKKIHPKRSPPAIKGAGEEHSGVYCAWNRNFGETPKENTLYILRWVYDEPTTPEETDATVKSMASILRRAQLEAYEWNMAQVEFWNPTPLLEKAVALLDPTAKVVHREDSSIACFRWTDAEKGPAKDVDWFWNEKYAWC